jgi:hypothetical protein
MQMRASSSLIAHTLAGFNAPEELIGKTDRDLSTEEHASAAFADEQRIMATGQR